MTTIQGGASIEFGGLELEGFTFEGPAGIRFVSDACGGTIRDCVFEGDGTGTAVQVGYDIEYISASLFDCTIRNMQSGVRTGWEASASVHGCHFENNGTLTDFNVEEMKDKFHESLKQGKQVAEQMQKETGEKDILVTIEKLDRLKDSGTITEKEFEKTKKELLKKL